MTPRLILPAISWPAAPSRRPTSSRSRASISAGPILGSRISSSPHSTVTATKPPSLTTAATGTDVPVVPRRRHRPRAAVRSVRASTTITSALTNCSTDDTSVGAERTVWDSSADEGRTEFGCASSVSSSKYIQTLQRTGWTAPRGKFSTGCDRSMPQTG